MNQKKNHDSETTTPLGIIIVAIYLVLGPPPALKKFIVLLFSIETKNKLAGFYAIISISVYNIVPSNKTGGNITDTLFLPWKIVSKKTNHPRKNRLPL